MNVEHLADIEAIKSYEGVNRVWIEEAETVSDNSLNTLLPTIRRDDAEIWFTASGTIFISGNR